MILRSHYSNNEIKPNRILCQGEKRVNGGRYVAESREMERAIRFIIEMIIKYDTSPCRTNS